MSAESGSYYGEDLLCLIFQGGGMDLEILDSREDFGIMVDYDAGVYDINHYIYTCAMLIC